MTKLQRTFESDPAIIQNLRLHVHPGWEEARKSTSHRAKDKQDIPASAEQNASREIIMRLIEWFKKDNKG